MEMNYKVYVHIAPNGKRYYGITKLKVNRRWRNGKGYQDNEYFYRAINKYGWDNFEHIVVARGLTEEEAKWIEIELIREWDTTNRDKGYNITKGGESANGYIPTEETRKKLSEAHKGKTHTEEHRKKVSEAKKGKNNPMYGKHHSEEHRQKISEAMKGKNKGKTFTKEHRKHVSEAQKGRTSPRKGKTLSEETRKKISEKAKGKNGKQIYCIELDKYFDTITEAGEFVGCSMKNISSVLHGKTKTAKGYHFIYAEDVEKLDIENSKVS